MSIRFHSHFHSLDLDTSRQKSTERADMERKAQTVVERSSRWFVLVLRVGRDLKKSPGQGWRKSLKELVEQESEEPKSLVRWERLLMKSPTLSAHSV